MELILGFSISAFIAVVAIDTLQQRRRNCPKKPLTRR